MSLRCFTFADPPDKTSSLKNHSFSLCLKKLSKSLNKKLKKHGFIDLSKPKMRKKIRSVLLYFPFCPKESNIVLLANISKFSSSLQYTMQSEKLYKPWNSTWGMTRMPNYNKTTLIWDKTWLYSNSEILILM